MFMLSSICPNTQTDKQHRIKKNHKFFHLLSFF
jgi:hypothetical protein